MTHILDRRFIKALVPTGSFLFLLAALALLSESLKNSAQFGELYSALLLLTGLGAVVLVTLIVLHFGRLIRQLRQRTPGSRLTARLVLMFVLLAVSPVSILFYFSVEFLQRGIESWFDVQIAGALNDALELSQTALENRQRALFKQTQQLAEQLSEVTDSFAALSLYELRQRSGATELTMLQPGGRIIAASSVDPTHIVPNRPDEVILLQVRQGGQYVGLAPLRDAGLHVQVVVPIPGETARGQRVLQALYPVARRLSQLAEGVQQAHGQYKQLAYLRKPLKQSFVLTLSLVLLLGTLSAVWAAFFSAQRLVAPIRELVAGTQAVAAGNYDRQLEPAGKDDLGFLVASFNDMTRRIASARDQARRSQQQVETQRAYLETVFGSLSSGVMSFNQRLELKTANQAAEQILEADLQENLGEPMDTLGGHYPYLAEFICSMTDYSSSGDPTGWRRELSLVDRGKVLMCKCSRLPQGGFVVVFDDITAVLQAQRNAAWGEVARRLAHEIKNPLTPIQLSAERLRHKYIRRLPKEDVELLDRLTRTIIQQVEVMKEMVNAFSQYARTPKLQIQRLDLNALIRELVELYRGKNSRAQVQTDLAADLPWVEADAGRIGQLLHNLLRNAVEACEDERAHIRVSTRSVPDDPGLRVELQVRDQGPGFPESILGTLFDPYVTTKTKGTGLGLAIVKKIAEEHSGTLRAENVPGGGACIIIRLPVRAGVHAALTVDREGGDRMR
jgi:nitrogen fixation/metabolism regulation signal transduction histidine kinase